MPKRKTTQKPTPETKATPLAPAETSHTEHILPAQASSFPIVGIGASAGGLAAFEAFFSSMPADADPGMAFVLVQHLAPDHKSILTDIIQRYTRMHVAEVVDGMVVQPNCTYIIPPNSDMAFLNGTLQLLEPTSPRGQRLPIDFFFRSLALDQRERAIGVVLSGTGSDGTLGVRAIKGEGGMVMVQDPATTEYDGMPRNALSTGLVDYVLPVSEMADQIIAYVAHALGKPPRPAALPVVADSALKKIFVLLRVHTGHDFSQYKPSTIHRRIERRMAVHQTQTMPQYVKYLQQNPSEVEALFRDLLIGVTNFFRDPSAFKCLEEQAIPQLFAGKPSGALIRVWVAGCSTGEEAYSLAILLQEHLEGLKQNLKVQVFATDIDSQAIATARAGIYPASIAVDILPERLERYFIAEAEGGMLRVQKIIRDILIFSEQNVIKDPPFSKLDLISCRNLLIYLDGNLQKAVIPLFHYALNPNGFLFLGTSETVGEFGELFSPLDRKLKLYQRKNDVPAINLVPLGRVIPSIKPMDLTLPSVLGRKADSGKLPLRELTEKTLLQQLAPAAALVNSKGVIFYLHGRTGLFLEPTPGEAGVNNILKMAREGLRRELTMCLRKVTLTGEIQRSHNLSVKTNGDYTSVDLTVCPVTRDHENSLESPLYLVIMEKVSPPDAIHSELITPIATGCVDHDDIDADARVEALKQELRSKEEYLQTSHEELETSNEELKSSNEEMQSVNEELQSTNEELETSKEELQSVNEELSTVNAEMQTKMADLVQTNDDMNNLIAGTGIATIFVDFKLNILRFTPTVTKIVNLVLSDVGRPVGHFASNLVGYNNLCADIEEVLLMLTPKELEVQTSEGTWYIMRIRPYRTQDNMIKGAVITFVDITEIKGAQASLKAANDLLRLASVVRDSYDAIMMLDLDGRIMAWNPSAQRLFGWSEAEAMAMNIRDLVPESLREDALEKTLQLVQGGILLPYTTQRITKDGRIVEVWLTATALLNDTKQVYAIATTERVSQIGG